MDLRFPSANFGQDGFVCHRRISHETCFQLPAPGANLLRPKNRCSRNTKISKFLKEIPADQVIPTHAIHRPGAPRRRLRVFATSRHAMDKDDKKKEKQGPREKMDC